MNPSQVLCSQLHVHPPPCMYCTWYTDTQHFHWNSNLQIALLNLCINLHDNKLLFNDTAVLVPKARKTPAKVLLSKYYA